MGFRLLTSIRWSEGLTGSRGVSSRSTLFGFNLSKRDDEQGTTRGRKSLVEYQLDD